MGKYRSEKARIWAYFAQCLAEYFQSKLGSARKYKFFQCAKIIRAQIYKLFNSAKIKGAKINHTKIRGAQSLMGLRQVGINS